MRPHGPALRIALLYALFGGLWILFSDAILEALAPDVAGLSAMQTAKGWFFVAVTACMLHAAMARELRLRSRSEEAERRARKDLETLREERDRLFATSIDILCVADFDGYFKQINPACTRIAGWSEEELLSRPWIEFVHPDDRDRAEAMADTLRQGTPVVDFELRAHCKDGSWRWISWNTLPIKERKTLFAVGRDVTEAKQARQALADSLAQKETLLREINHRVKNNMQVVVSLCALEMDKMHCAEDVEIMRRIELRIRSMAMVHEMLYRSGDVNRIDFADYLRTLVQHLHTSFSSGGGRIRLETDIAPLCLGIDQALPCGLLANEIMTNAFRHAFGPDDTGVIRVGLEVREHGDEARVVLTVADDGTGMPPDMVPETAESTGLTLMRHLAGQLRGRIAFGNDGGVTVTVSFAVRDGNRPAPC